MVHPPSYQHLSAERGRDRGHFNQYGMRDDGRDPQTVDGENPADGLNAQRFGGGGDAASYGNRVPSAANDAAPPAPTLAVSAGGSARALGLDYGGERHRDRPLSSRQGAALFHEWADHKR